MSTCTYSYAIFSDTDYVQNLLEEIYMPEEFLRLLLGGVGWGLGTLFAGQGDIQREWCICHLQPFQENGASATSAPRIQKEDVRHGGAVRPGGAVRVRRVGALAEESRKSSSRFVASWGSCSSRRSSSSCRNSSTSRWWRSSSTSRWWTSSSTSRRGSSGSSRRGSCRRE